MSRNKPKWRKTLGLLMVGSLISDLTIYFSYQWWSFLFLIVGSVVISTAIDQRFSPKVPWFTIWTIILAMPITIYVVTTSSPEELVQWNNHRSPWKYLLP